MSTVFRTNGGIINSVLKSGQLRFFKIVGAGATDFAWTMSDGTVNLPPQYVTAGSFTVVPGFQYDAAGNPIPYTGQPVPNSAAEYILKALSEKCEIVGMSLVSGGTAQTDGVANDYGSTSEIHIACTTHNFGWGLAINPATGAQWVSAEAEMQAVVQALPSATVYLSTGALPAPPATQDAVPPVSTTANFGGITVAEVQLVLV